VNGGFQASAEARRSASVALAPICDGVDAVFTTNGSTSFQRGPEKV